MQIEHAFLDRDTPSVTIFDASGTPYFFAPEHFDACHKFNRHLREHGTREGFVLGVPGAYEQLTELWNADENVTHRFAEYDIATDSVTVRGSALPDEVVAQLHPPVPAPAPVVEAEPQFTTHQTNTINRMLWAAAAREAHFAEMRDANRNKKVDDRKRKREDHRAADAARSYQRPRTIERDVERVFVRASGSKTSSKSKVAGPSKSGGSSKPAQEREDTAMDEDEDAEGEPEKQDDELIEYSEDEEAETSKAEGKKRAGPKRA